MPRAQAVSRAGFPRQLGPPRRLRPSRRLRRGLKRVLGNFHLVGRASRGHEQVTGPAALSLDRLRAAYISHDVLINQIQKAPPPQNRQLILYYYYYKQQVDEFVLELT